jgi:putative heme-binding domain-containing protein
MRGHQDSRVSDLVGKIFPSVTSAGRDWNRHIAEVEKILKGPQGNPIQGESIFLQRCSGCHKLFSKGGNIGPDLTTYQRDNLGTMLLSIINPNAEIREGFEYSMVQTNDGRALSGFLVESDTQTTTLRGLEGEDIVLRRSEIKSLAPIGRSLMPEGLLDDLSEKELRDLFTYLRSSQPITR